MSTFSVIIPVHNADKYLDKSILSVVNQSFNKWELLLINDGSTDQSLKIAKEWSKKDKRIIVLQHPNSENKGVSASRNLGISAAKGQWIAFLDADDYWLPNKLEKQYEIINTYEGQDLVFVYCPAQVIDEFGKPISEKSSIKKHNPLFGMYGAGKPGFQKDAFHWVINKGFEAPTSSVVCLKDVIQELGGFEEDMQYSEDGLMWYRIIEKGNMFYINETLLAYRVHSSQWNASVTSQLKISRRFIGYERLLIYVSGPHRTRISYLLVNKGFRVIVRNNIGFPRFKLNLIKRYWLKLINNPNIYSLHKFLSMLVVISEILVLPLRIGKIKLVNKIITST